MFDLSTEVNLVFNSVDKPNHCRFHAGEEGV